MVRWRWRSRDHEYLIEERSAPRAVIDCVILEGLRQGWCSLCEACERAVATQVAVAHSRSVRLRHGWDGLKVHHMTPVAHSPSEHLWWSWSRWVVHVETHKARVEAIEDVRLDVNL